jgi:hypothetical protein
VLLVIRSEEAHLRFLMHPELDTVVKTEDLAYIESLLQDFLRRAEDHPALLFKQIAALAVGPLVTHQVGSCLSEYPSLQALSSRFVEM